MPDDQADTPTPQGTQAAQADPRHTPTDRAATARPPRAARRLCRAVGALAGVLALALTAAWAAGRLASDLWPASQWLFWTPPEAFALATALAAAPALAWLRGPARLLPAAAALMIALHTAVWHWRLPNALTRDAGAGHVRVIHWNATEATDPSLQRFLRNADPFALRTPTPAIIVLTNPPLRLPWRSILATLAPDELPAAKLPQHLVRAGRFIVISGPPVGRRGTTFLGLQGRTPDERRFDNGKALFAIAAVGEHALTLWAIDWPSDPDQARSGYVRPTLEAIADSSHLDVAPTPAGPLREIRREGFPPPDVVVGDFNTARGSRAVADLLAAVGPMASAHAQGGLGPDYTWPRAHAWPAVPLLGLDQAFVRRGTWRTIRYDVEDAGSGTHLAQRLALSPTLTAPR